MFEGLFISLTSALNSMPGLALAASFGWGCLSILLSPCHLASIPLIIAYLTERGDIPLKRACGLAVIFSSGIFITVGIIGGVTAAIGRILGDIGVWGNLAVGGIFILVALYLFDLISIPRMTVGTHRVKRKGFLGALILGMLIGIALGPCTFAYLAPVLGVVFHVISSSTFFALFLLISYAAGHSMVIIFFGAIYGKVQHYLDWTSKSKTVLIVKKSAGVFVFLAGGYILFSAIRTL